jgi:hypothetical protein
MELKTTVSESTRSRASAKSYSQPPIARETAAASFRSLKSREFVKVVEYLRVHAFAAASPLSIEALIIKPGVDGCIGPSGLEEPATA